MRDPSEPLENAFMNKSLLIIDESVALRQVLREIFVSRGCQVLTAANHEEAIPHLRENSQIDLILLDLDYPLWDGKKVLQELQNKTPGPKLLILSNIGANDDLELFYRQLEALVLRKPFTINELTDQAQTLLHNLPDGNSPATH